MFPSKPFEARLVAARMIAPSVRELTFERIDGEPFAFDPGQWVNLTLSSSPDGDLKRAYSIASPPDGTPRFSVAVTRVEGGAGSRVLHEMALGESLRAVGPQGLFTRAANVEVPALFVATGTGLAPFRSMLLAALASGSRAPMWILFGCRFEADILYRDELERLAREHPNVRYEVTLSRAHEAWVGRRGYVQAHLGELVRELGRASSARPHVYVCGLGRMVSTVRELARGELGLERREVHQERYD